MSITERIVRAPADRVFGVLSDGWTYSDWVVGTAHIRDVDEGWPRAGTRLHHNAGPWPTTVKDRSESLECEPGRMLRLKVHLWPLGAGEVRFTLDELDPGATRVTMQEQFTDGPMVGVRNKVGDVFLHYRNAEVLRRLADLAERRQR
ncbi:SRPBCC family protein [Dactylosporangium sp. AC04546]|uniref:SRPBCC family protein n=1 Tax=Dactylosporangium sp. AC04546 TaxID=2862460 RepID=UPI001EDEB906|nr:SRPBCC family protein [Dactylosporangium sp. AC04546]WVK84406.1 SRPBCC family protein [Dactylosporangium sp. AC04546]